MKYRAITTCNFDGWRLTGRAMVKSFCERWKEVPLTIYAEGFYPTISGMNDCFEIERLPDWLTELKARYKDNAEAHGAGKAEYNFRRDFIRFAHKVAAITDAASKTEDVLIWLDADTFTHDDVTVGWLDWLFPQPAYIAWLDRPMSYPECGFLMINCAHAAHETIMTRLRDLYVTGSALALPETHDSFLIKTVIQQAVREKLIEHPVNLSHPDHQKGHVFVSSPLGSRMDHAKGDRKQEGRSPKRERKVADSIPYWR